MGRTYFWQANQVFLYVNTHAEIGTVLLMEIRYAIKKSRTIGITMCINQPTGCHYLIRPSKKTKALTNTASMVRTMDLCDTDYWQAACLDTACEQLPLNAISAACQVAQNAEQFFWAVQAAIRLKGVCDGL